MAYAGLLATVNLYTAEKADLTSQLSTIMESISRATGESSQISSDEASEQSALAAKYGTDSTEYEVANDELEHKYDAQLKAINAWESELQVQKQNLETQVQEVSSYLESFQSALKDNVKKDFKYGQKS
jgi:hypothetical protein